MTTINLNTMLKQAITLAREHHEMTNEEIISQLMANQPLEMISFAAPVKAVVVEKAEKKTEKKTEKAGKTADRTRAAPAKPRAIPEGDTRCCARSFYEKEHLEGGSLKIMRDDAENLYGDRCKFKKSGDTEFCKHHSEKQPLGIWGAEYSGKFKVLVEKQESGVVAAPKEKKAKEPKEKKVEVVAPVELVAAVQSDDEEEEEEDEVLASHATHVPILAIEEPEGTEVEECTIDGKTYLKDEEGTIYDEDSNDEVGKYDFAAKKWLSRK